jgi:hypothetical protein
MTDFGLISQENVGSDYPSITKMANIPTLQQRIDLAVKQAEEKLTAVKRAREILAKNPDLEELLNIMQRSHF